MQWFLVLAIVFSTAISDLLQSSQMRQHSGAGPRQAAVSFVRQPLMSLSVAFMIASFGAFLLLLQSADLTFAVPATAVGFVVETALARWFLHEQVGVRRWMASFLIACGVALLAF